MEKLFKLGASVLGFVVVAALVFNITNMKLTNLREMSMPSSSDVVSIRDRMKQLDCLAINVYREAGYESFEGKVAVAQVTMNRVNSGKFPKDVCGVVQQKSVIMDRVVCQFSWYCDNVHKARPVNKTAYQESYEVAKKVLLEGFKLDIMKDAMYYHAVYVNPNWNKPKIGKIGNHIFYKDI